jgi:hypothetical protein
MSLLCIVDRNFSFKCFFFNINTRSGVIKLFEKEECECVRISKEELGFVIGIIVWIVLEDLFMRVLRVGDVEVLFFKT